MANKKSTTKTKEVKTTKTKKNKGILMPIIGAIISAIVIIGIIIAAVLIIDSVSKKQRIGNYDITSLNINGQEENSVDLLNQLGLKAHIELRSDNTCTMDIFGDNGECTYTDNEIKMNNTGATYSYSYSNNEIILNQNDNKMTFTRIKE